MGIPCRSKRLHDSLTYREAMFDGDGCKSRREELEGKIMEGGAKIQTGYGNSSAPHLAVDIIRLKSRVARWFT